MSSVGYNKKGKKGDRDKTKERKVEDTAAQVVMMNADHVKYRKAKAAKHGDKSVLEAMKSGVERRNKLRLFHGAPLEYEPDKTYKMRFGHILPGGHIGLAFPADDARRIPGAHNSLFKNPEQAAHFKIEPEEALVIGMMVVIVRPCAIHGELEIVRGFLEDVDLSTGIAEIFLVDDFNWIKVHRNELYRINLDYFYKRFLSILAQLDEIGYDIFSQSSLGLDIDQLIGDVVKEHQHASLHVRFATLGSTRAHAGHQYKVRIYIDGVNRWLHELILVQLLEKVTEKFPTTPNSVTYGHICHADEDGKVFLHLDGTIGLVDVIQEYLSRIAPKEFRDAVQKPMKMDNDSAFNAVYIVDYLGEHCRAKIVQYQSEIKKATIQYIDYGNYGIVSPSEMALASKINPVLSVIPSLFVPVYLKDVTQIVNVGKFKEEHLKKTYKIQVQAKTIDNIPTVVLYDEKDLAINEKYAKL